jgi:hypothetical protein
MPEAVLLRLLSRYPHPATLARNAAGASLFPALGRLERARLVTRRGGLYRLTVRGSNELALGFALGRVVSRALNPS